MNEFIMAVLEKSYECIPCAADGSAASKLLSEYEQLKSQLHRDGCSEELRRFLDVSEQLRQSERKAVYLGALITGITLHKALSPEQQEALLSLCEQELIEHGYRPGKSK